MVSLITSRRRKPKHARTPRAAHKAPREASVPRKFWPVLIWRDRKRRGLWCNPEHEDMMIALGRELDAWQRQRNG